MIGKIARVVFIVAVISVLLMLHFTNYIINYFYDTYALVSSLLMNPYLSIAINAIFIVLLIVQMVKPQRRHLYVIAVLLVPVWMSFFSMTFSVRTGELMLRYDPVLMEMSVRFADLRQVDVHRMYIVITTENKTIKYYTPFIKNDDIRAKIYGNCQSYLDGKCHSYKISYP